MRSRIILATLLLACMLSTACLKDVVRELSKDVSEMKALHSELTEKFRDPVFVNINHTGDQAVLNVTFINSDLNNKASGDRFERAQQTASIVKAHPGVGRLTAIWVVFVREKTTLLVLHERAVVEFFGFDKEANRLAGSQPSARNGGVELSTSINYLEQTNETDVSVSGIQLYGTPGRDGLTVLPHFTIAGDVRKAKAKPPKKVSFDFASYSLKEQFGGEVPIEVIADSTYVLRTKGTFNVSRTSGTVSEFCYLKVPYAVFRKMIGAKQVLISINDRAYLLTPEQFAALQQMSYYLQE